MIGEVANAIEKYKVLKDELSELSNLPLNMNTENEWLELKVDNDDPYMIGEYIPACLIQQSYVMRIMLI